MSARTLLADRRAVAAAAVLLVALGALPALLGRPQPDTAWLLSSAGRVLGGARLYVDVVEVNPPLIVWLDLVPAALGRALHLPVAPIFAVLVVLLAVGSVAAASRLLALLFPDRPAFRRLLVLAALFILLPLSREDFGQREHLFLALSLPYVILTALRVSGRPVALAAAMAIGVAAGVGIALKPYFILLWGFLEVALLSVGRPRRPAIRPESLAVIAVGLLYLCAVLRWAPDYFQVVRSMAGPYYDFLSNTLFVTALLGDGAVLPIVALFAVFALRNVGRTSQVWSVVAWGMAGLWIAAVLQHKGWRYHFYPALGLGTWLLVLIVADVRRPLRRGTEQLYAALSAAIVLATVGVTLGVCALQSVDPRASRYDVDPDLQQLLPVVREHAAGGSMAMLSWSIASAFPLATEAGVQVASRFPSLWTLGAIYWPAVRSEPPIRYHVRADMGPLERYVNDAVVEDLRTWRPAVLAVLRPGPDRREWGLRRLDFLAYFLRDPRFASVFERYTYLAQVGEYWVFVRLPESAPGSGVSERPAQGVTGRPDPGLAGGSAPLSWGQMLAGLGFVGLVWVIWRRQRQTERRDDTLSI